MEEKEINIDELDLDPKDKKRIKQIDARIEDLEAHQKMWAKAGGVGGRMAIQAIGEINSLKGEKRRILNGTQKQIDEIKEKQAKLKSELRKISKLRFKKRKLLEKQIVDFDREIDYLKR